MVDLCFIEGFSKVVLVPCQLPEVVLVGVTGLGKGGVEIVIIGELTDAGAHQGQCDR